MQKTKFWKLFNQLAEREKELKTERMKKIEAKQQLKWILQHHKT